VVETLICVADWYRGNDQSEKKRIENLTFPLGYSPYKTRGDCHYDQAKADKAVKLIESFVWHTKGFTGRLKLEQWQRDIIQTIFGWVRPDGTRRYREVYLEVARKNGKSLLQVGIGLVCLYFDGESGPEIYSAASDTEQARIIFDGALYQVEQNPSLKRRSQTFRKSIVVPQTAGSWKVLSSKPKHGTNPSCVLFDELHQQPNDELWAALKTGLASRKQPLWVSTTTAGQYGTTSLCWQRHEYAESVANGLYDAPYFLPIIYAAPIDAYWTDPKVWRLANPNLGVSVKEQTLTEDCDKAKKLPAEENNFRRYNLCQWVEHSGAKWVSADKWKAC